MIHHIVNWTPLAPLLVVKASWDSITSFSEAAEEAVGGCTDDSVDEGGCCVLYVDVLASSKFAAAALASEVETASSTLLEAAPPLGSLQRSSSSSQNPNHWAKAITNPSEEELKKNMLNHEN